MPDSTGPRGNLDWQTVVGVLRAIHRIAPEFLLDNALIGGAACWFYRAALQDVNDRDFRVPAFLPVEEEAWLSKDVDFLGVPVAEYPKIFGTAPTGDPPKITIAGIWVNSPDAGLTLSPAQCVKDAASASIDDGGIEFIVADPISLFREKHVLCTLKAGRAQDRLHLAVLREYLYFDLASRLEGGAVSAAEAKKWRDDARETKTIDQQFHMDDRYRRRIHASLTRAGFDVPKPVTSYIAHHIPPPAGG